MNKQLRSEAAKRLSFLPEISLSSYPPTLLSSFKCRAFTLAEVLITLAIIGVVAALTLPAFIQNYRKQATVNQLKASYSLLSQAVQSSVNENGEISSWDFTLSSREFADKYVLPYLKVTKKIDNSKDWWRVATLSTEYNKTSYYGFSYLPDFPVYVLSNGSAIKVERYYNNSDNEQNLLIDINGRKGPNVLGIDGFVFVFSQAKNRFVPCGLGNSRDVLLGRKKGVLAGACIRDNSWQYYRGMTCAALIMTDGWKISDDYPWGNGGRTPIPKN